MARSFERASERFDRAQVLLGILGEFCEVVIERGVDHAVRRLRRGAAEQVEVIERAAQHFRADAASAAALSSERARPVTR